MRTRNRRVVENLKVENLKGQDDFGKDVPLLPKGQNDSEVILSLGRGRCFHAKVSVRCNKARDTGKCSDPNRDGQGLRKSDKLSLLCKFLSKVGQEISIGGP